MLLEPYLRMQLQPKILFYADFPLNLSQFLKKQTYHLKISLNIYEFTLGVVLWNN